MLLCVAFGFSGKSKGITNQPELESQKVPTPHKRADIVDKDERHCSKNKDS